MIYLVPVTGGHIPDAQLIELYHPPASGQVVLRRSVTFEVFLIVGLIEYDKRQSFAQHDAGIGQIPERTEGVEHHSGSFRIPDAAYESIEVGVDPG
ncbi:hypothetical protein [Lysobacter sp. ESA13C]|uniref:hypothetical protein n=1 Tax=unclassified Lysobacter TaxID=2635362 RepID=UPI001CC0CDBA|nr:hypothetical protein [Lysobacter sp. ESA13C]